MSELLRVTEKIVRIVMMYRKTAFLGKVEVSVHRSANLFCQLFIPPRGFTGMGQIKAEKKHAQLDLNNIPIQKCIT